MKKSFMLLALFLLVPFTALATFPVTSKLTIDESQPGFVKVIGSQNDLSYINVLQQDCIDSLRVGCGKSVTVYPSEVGQGYKIFPLDPEARMDGQNAYNFRTEKNGEWLHIPDCNVEMGANTDMEMSSKVDNITLSGGAHFVSVSAGRGIFDSISSGGGCGGGSYQATAKPAYTHPVAYRAPRVAAKPPCDPCEEIKAVKADTTAIRASVGEVESQAPADERTIQQKTRKTLDKVVRVEKVTDRNLSITEKIAAQLGVNTDGSPSVDSIQTIVLPSSEKSQPAAPVAQSSQGNGALSGWHWFVIVVIVLLLLWGMYYLGSSRSSHRKVKSGEEQP